MSKKTHSPQSVINRVFGKNLFLVSGFLITIGLFLLLVFVTQKPITQTQDLASQASVKNGLVEITSTANPAQLMTGVDNTIHLRINTSGQQVGGVQLVFDVLATGVPTLELTSASPRLAIVSQEVEHVTHGFKVSAVLLPSDPTQSLVTSTPEPFLDITLKPESQGSIFLNFDVERSHATQHKSDPPIDLLTHINVYEYFIQSPTSLINADDFTLLTDSLDSRFSFFETTGSRNEVDRNTLVKGRTYTVKHQVKIQNSRDDLPSTSDPVLTTKLVINNLESVTRTFNRSTLSKATDPLTLQFETSFVAKDSNTFLVTVDGTNAYAETNEDNNSTTSIFGTTTSTSCNIVCENNGNCADSQRCYDTGSDKRCRLVTNLSSTSCTSIATPGRSCNQYCADTNECAEGYNCWYNKCRNPYNVESESCVNPSNRTLELIRENCNVSCSANKDCANNMRCLSGSCRLATNPSSTSCSASTVATVSKGYVKATPKPTATPKTTAKPSPTASASATPTPTPIPTVQPTPVATPEPIAEPESALDAVFGWMTSLFQADNPVSKLVFSSALIPIAIIGAGILLLIIALVVVLKPKRTMINLSSIETKPPVSSATTFHAKPNPPPPPIPSFGTILPTEKSRTNLVTAHPETIETPPIEEMKAQAAQGSQTMLERLKAKGIQAPAPKAESASQISQTTQPDQGEPPVQTTPPSDNSWPEDEMVR